MSFPGMMTASATASDTGDAPSSKDGMSYGLVLVALLGARLRGTSLDLSIKLDMAIIVLSLCHICLRTTAARPTCTTTRTTINR